jgi:hypothetical protein
MFEKEKIGIKVQTVELIFKNKTQSMGKNVPDEKSQDFCHTIVNSMEGGERNSDSVSMSMSIEHGLIKLRKMQSLDPELQ